MKSKIMNTIGLSLIGIFFFTYFVHFAYAYFAEDVETKKLRTLHIRMAELQSKRIDLLPHVEQYQSIESEIDTVQEEINEISEIDPSFQ